jgi:hypothetical protein
MPGRDMDIVRASPFMSPCSLAYPQFRWVNIRPTAQQSWLPRREWTVVDDSMGVWGHELTDFFTRRFPNAVPEGTRVPHWALMDPTVRSLITPCQNPANKMSLVLLLQLEGFWDLTASLHAGGKQVTLPLLTFNNCLILCLLPRLP